MITKIAVAFLILTGIILCQEHTPDIRYISLDSLLALPVHAASRFMQTTSDAPASVTIITSEDIDYYGYRSLGELLLFVKSFYISNDRNYTYTGVRGFSRPSDYNNRILLLLNGQRINENIYGSAMIGNELGLDMSIIDRIEIVRGPGSVLYGTNAMFSVINLITKGGKQVDGLNARIEYGSFNHRKAVLNYGREYQNGLEVAFSGNISDSQGEDIYFAEFDTDSTNSGVAVNKDKESFYNLFNSVKYKDFTFHALYTNRKKHIPTAPFNTLFNNDTYTTDRFANIKFGYSSELYENFQVLFKTYYNYYYYTGFYPYLEDDNLIYYQDESIGDQLGGEAQLMWDILINNRIVAGVEYINSINATYTYRTEDNVLYDRNHPYSNISFYINNNYEPFNNFMIISGIRGEKYSGIDLHVTPRAGLVYRFNSTAFKILYGQAFRIPNVYESNYYDLLSDHKRSEGLKNEKINTAELIIESRFSKKLFSAISLFHNRLNNLIDTRLDDSDSLYQFVNVDNTKAYGAELSLQFHLYRDIRSYLNYTFQRALDAANDIELSNVPEHVLNAGLIYYPLRNVSIAAEMHYETGRKTVYDTRTENFYLFNLNLISAPFNDNFILALKVNNILDNKYSLPGSVEHIQAAIPQKGRSLVLSLGYKFL